MRDDLLKEQLMDYARSGAEVAFQPGPADIHRRARRHVQRLAALTAAAVLVAGAIGLGLGLRHAGSVPVVNHPRPPVTVAPPVAAPPDSFVTVVAGGAGADSGDLAVVSTATGEMVRSLAQTNGAFFTVSRDRRWVYFSSTSSTLPSTGIYRVPYAGGAATKVADITEPTQLAVSPDGSRLAWEATSGNRPALAVRDLAGGRERLLPVPGPLSGPRTISRGSWTWSPDGRQLAVLVVHGISSGYEELMTVDVATGTWRHRFDFDARHGGGPGCCEAIGWPAGSGRIAVVRAVAGAGGKVRQHRLVYVDPATGATTPGPVLAGRDVTFGPDLDFDASGRYVLFGLQDDHSVSTWWSRGGGNPVLVKRIELGDQVPAEVAGAYAGGGW
jgi:WD40-like Beta Propeller Repeat